MTGALVTNAGVIPVEAWLAALVLRAGPLAWWTLAVVWLLAAGLLWRGRRVPLAGWRRRAVPAMRLLVLLLLTLVLLDPAWRREEAVPGMNEVAVVVDTSASLGVRDRGAGEIRAGQVRDALHQAETGWLPELAEVFDVARYRVDRRLQRIDHLAPEGGLSFDGVGTVLGEAMEAMQRRGQHRPLAAVLLVTDGNATDAALLESLGDDLPPVHVVVVGDDEIEPDLALGEVRVTETAFEDAPVMLETAVAAQGFGGRQALVTVASTAGEELARETVVIREDVDRQPVRLRFRPESRGLHFYTVEVALTGDDGEPDPEAAEAVEENNRRTVVAGRSTEAARLLYVGGRPGWEFKFLRRALEEDDEVRVTGLVRLADREPRFDFRGRRGESGNPLFRGFTGDGAGAGAEERPRYDEAVWMRFGAHHAEELQDGFPDLPEELMEPFHAVLLADLDAEFLRPGQLELLRDFVSRRGGGLLFLGGLSGFAAGDYDRPLWRDLLPVVLGSGDRQPAPSAPFMFELAREGWLEPWVRLRATDDDERARMGAMPGFRVFSRLGEIKPGAAVLALGRPGAVVEEVRPGLTGGLRFGLDPEPVPTAPQAARGDNGEVLPLLVTHRFGRGQVGALAVGDFWRWGMKSPAHRDDMNKAWRQMMRWLVSTAEGRVVLERAGDRPGDGAGGLQRWLVRVRDPSFRPQADAAVRLELTASDGREVLRSVVARPTADEAGAFEAWMSLPEGGAWRLQAVATGGEGERLGEAEAGWVEEPWFDEFRELVPDRQAMQRLADRSGGSVLEWSQLERWARDLRQAPVEHRRTVEQPLWHNPWWLMLVVGLLAGEWWLRRSGGAR